MDILKGKYQQPHVSIWWYRLDDEKEVGDPSKWMKANPNLGKTVSYETYQLDVERAENAPAAKNDILAKRFGIPCEATPYSLRISRLCCIDRSTSTVFHVPWARTFHRETISAHLRSCSRLPTEVSALRLEATSLPILFTGCRRP